jgi:hypothetical protein
MHTPDSSLSALHVIVQVQPLVQIPIESFALHNLHTVVCACIVFQAMRRSSYVAFTFRCSQLRCCRLQVVLDREETNKSADVCFVLSLISAGGVIACEHVEFWPA